MGKRAGVSLASRVMAPALDSPTASACGVSSSVCPEASQSGYPVGHPPIDFEQLTLATTTSALQSLKVGLSTGGRSYPLKHNVQLLLLAANIMVG